MRMAIISDIHSNLTALEKALGNLDVDLKLFLGDFVSDGFCDNEVIALVKRHYDYAVIGNRDRDLISKDFDPLFLNKRPLYSSKKMLNLESIAFLKSLKDIEVVYVSGFKILMIHGDGVKGLTVPSEMNDAYDYLIENYDFDVCLFGHNHLYSTVNYRERLFINPGSLGIPADSPSHKFCILTIAQADFSVELVEIVLVNRIMKIF